MSSAGGELREGFGDPQSLVTMNFEAASTSLISLLRVLCCCFLVGLVCFFLAVYGFLRWRRMIKPRFGSLEACVAAGRACMEKGANFYRSS